MDDRWTELRKLAEAATPGPWEADGGGEISQQHGPCSQVVSSAVSCMGYCYGGVGEGVTRKEDAAYIAAANPSAILELLDELEALRPRPETPDSDPAWGEGVRRVIEDGDVYYLRGEDLHREDGPAIERADGTRAWYRDNLLHRLDGPAVEYANSPQEFWISGQQVESDDPRLQLPGPTHS